VQNVSLRSSVLVSPRWHDAPFAMAGDGIVLLNVAEFDDAKTLEAQLAIARRQRSRVFIGVEVTPAELVHSRELLHDALREGAVYLAGMRQARVRQRRGRKES
jgi:hypothetical protein